MDVLAEAALDGRVTWQQAHDAVSRFDEPEEIPRPALSPLELPAVARAILARITDPGQRARMTAYAALQAAALGVKPDGRPAVARDVPAPHWWQGATPDEVLHFRLFPGGPTGDDLPLLEEAAVEERLRTAVWLSGQPGGPTRWLQTYTARLLAERRRRTAAA